MMNGIGYVVLWIQRHVALKVCNLCVTTGAYRCSNIRAKQASSLDLVHTNIIPLTGRFFVEAWTITIIIVIIAGENAKKTKQ
jgi:hypothetical protein